MGQELCLRETKPETQRDVCFPFQHLITRSPPALSDHLWQSLARCQEPDLEHRLGKKWVCRRQQCGNYVFIVFILSAGPLGEIKNKKVVLCFGMLIMQNKFFIFSPLSVTKTQKKTTATTVRTQNKQHFPKMFTCCSAPRQSWSSQLEMSRVPAQQRKRKSWYAAVSHLLGVEK